LCVCMYVVEKLHIFIEDEHMLVDILLARLSAVNFPWRHQWKSDANEFDSLLFREKVLLNIHQKDLINSQYNKKGSN
jgi:hypothetical protein